MSYSYICLNEIIASVSEIKKKKNHLHKSKLQNQQSDILRSSIQKHFDERTAFVH